MAVAVAVEVNPESNPHSMLVGQEGGSVTAVQTPKNCSLFDSNVSGYHEPYLELKMKPHELRLR